MLPLAACQSDRSEKKAESEKSPALTKPQTQTFQSKKSSPLSSHEGKVDKHEQTYEVPNRFPVKDGTLPKKEDPKKDPKKKSSDDDN